MKAAKEKPVLIDSKAEMLTMAQAGAENSSVQRERLSARGSERIMQQSGLHQRQDAEYGRNDRTSCEESDCNKSANHRYEHETEGVLDGLAVDAIVSYSVVFRKTRFQKVA